MLTDCHRGYLYCRVSITVIAQVQFALRVDCAAMDQCAVHYGYVTNSSRVIQLVVMLSVGL